MEYEVIDNWKQKIVHTGTKEQCENYLRGNNVYQMNYSKLRINKKEKMETTMNVNDVKKELMKSKVNAKFSHYVSGNLYYIVELADGVYQFPIPTVDIEDDYIGGTIDRDIKIMSLSSDLGTTSFYNEMRGSELNRWISKAIDKNEFIKVG